MIRVSKTRMARRFGILTVVAVSIALVGAVAATPQTAQAAADPASFDAGNLISDAVFYDGNGTSVATIQSLLNSKGAGCHAAGTLPCLKDIKVAIPASAANAYCLAIAKSTSASAAQVFATVGHACSINPSVLVVLVEKEQALVSRASPTATAYEHATGFNCPDTAPCSTATAGFYTQIYTAAKQFQVYKALPGDFNYRAGANNSIAYHPASTPPCGASNVYIANNATAGLYDYTPYQPDTAALKNLYGTGDACSSYGNRNFWRLYNDWFGNSGNLLKSASFESSVTGWNFSTGMNRALHATAAGAVSTAQSGAYYLAANVPVVGDSIQQSVAIRQQVGQSYTGSIWLRSSSATVPYTGKLVLWGLGGTNESSTVPFSVGSTWTQVSTTLNITKASHTQLRLQVYMGTKGTDLQLDSAEVSLLPYQASAGPVSIASPGFESGIGGWTFTNGFMNRAVYDLPKTAHSGSHFLASNTAVAGRSVGLDVAHAPHAGDTYTATIWMRSGSGTKPFTGQFAMWALGGTSENAVTTFSVGSTWTPVTVNLPIVNSGHTRLRMEVYLGSVSYDLQLDDVSLTANLISNGSFESGVAPLAQSNGTATVTSVASDPTVPGLVDGKHAAEFSVATAGSSVAISVPRRLTVGQTYTASVWLRNTSSTTAMSGKLVLWELGAQSLNSQSPVFTLPAANGWVQEQVKLTVQNAANTSLKLEIYDNSPGVQVVMDNVQLQ
jgi:Carbohydrate binding domain